jgi:hypothetical protein
MNFVVPTIDGEGWMKPEEAEAAWQACRKGAEGDAGQDALARRVYRLGFNHNGSKLDAVIGERDPYDKQQTVVAIIAFPGYYKICLTVRGFLKVGDTPMVGTQAVLEVEDFDPASYSPA